MRMPSMMKGDNIMYMRTCTFCVERHRDAYSVNNMEKLASVIGIARATQCVCAVWLLQV